MVVETGLEPHVVLSIDRGLPAGAFIDRHRLVDRQVAPGCHLFHDHVEVAPRPLPLREDERNDLLKAPVDLVEAFVDLPEAFVDLLEALVDLPEAFVDLLEPFLDVLEPFVDPREPPIHRRLQLTNFHRAPILASSSDARAAP